MLEKLIGVSPPLAGKAQDSKVDPHKDLKEETQGKYKSDFEKTLKEKLALKQKDKKEASDAKPPHSKQIVAKKDDKELRADKKDKKSSGGIKKKMTQKSDKQNISNVMASSENEVEIPESKTDLAEFEANPSEQKIETQSAGLKPQGEVTSPAEPKQIEVLDQKIGTPLSDDFAAVEAKPIETPLDIAKATEAPVLAKPEAPAYNFEKEIGAQVGFQSEIAAATQGPAEATPLMQKMKAFETEKSISADKVQDFEKSVFEQLQKASVIPVATGPQSDSSNADSHKEKDQGTGDQLMQQQPKMDLAHSTSDLFHAGQSNVGFKSHLAPTSALSMAELTHQSRLEESHDQNVKEIMNQAQYLVKQGGGEMNVKMNPDGLAEVQLKVLLQDGRVNIEMHTEDKAVKKLMQDSLSELKSGLAALHLNVDHVKINSVSATNTDNSAQLQSNLNQGSDERQREFWNKFQDNLNQNSARKSNYATDKGVKGIKSAQRSAQSASVTDAAGQLPRSMGRTGQQVNRVA